ncbi:MAG: SAM-dependent methyltransferase [Clostridia bacterium]|nr:SAM-dependent methyltransferase [Clostridia bacterium]
MSKAEIFASYVQTAAASAVLRCVTVSSPRDKSAEVKKIRGELRNIGGECVLQLEYSLTEGRLRHENIPVPSAAQRILDLIPDFTRAELYAGDSSASLMISKKGKETLVTTPKFESVIENKSDADVRGNDRKKTYIIHEDAPFLQVLGVSDKNGRVHDKKRAKFRQINRFAEYARDYLERMQDDELFIADMCCGKSYLSFALYHLVTAVLGKSCRMVCVDLKRSVIDDVSAAARDCGFDGMEFVCEDISKFTVSEPPHMTVSLHACDVATDMVLDFAIRSGSRTILSTPCCHHELNDLLDSPQLDFIACHSVLRQKLCAAATDSLRLLRLKAAGYKADAVEFIDPEDTPKNVMLRGRFTGKRDAAAAEKYREAYSSLTGKDAPNIPEREM